MVVQRFKLEIGVPEATSFALCIVLDCGTSVRTERPGTDSAEVLLIRVKTMPQGVANSQGLVVVTTIGSHLQESATGQSQGAPSYWFRP